MNPRQPSSSLSRASSWLARIGISSAICRQESGFGSEKVSLAAGAGEDRGDQLLADRVQRGVRHLREELLEVIEQRLCAVGEDGQRGIRAHRPDRLLAGGPHRADDVLEVLEGIAESDLAVEQRVRIGAGDIRGPRQVGQGHHVLAEPLPVGPGRGEPMLQLIVADDPPGLEVDQEHLAGFEPPLLDDPLRGDFQGADLGGHDHPVVVGHDITAGPQAVAVEHRADDVAIGERHRCGTIPGLHQAAMIFVEVLLNLRHRFVVLPRLGDEHHHGVGERIARPDEQLHGVVEAGRVAEPLADDRHDLRDVARLIAIRGEQGLARLHPVDVAAQCIDLAVVRDHPIRVGQLPTGERVGAEPRVEHAQRAGQQGVAQVVGEVAAELLGREHPLVDQRPAREAREVEELAIVEPQGLDLALEPLADDVELPLELVGVQAGGLRPTKACHMTGSTARAPSPSDEESVAIGRQPRNACPSSETIRSKRDFPIAAGPPRRDVKNAPTP